MEDNLSKNFVWMAAANIVSSLFSAVLFIYLARALDPEALGYISYAFTIIFFLANFIDLGLSTYGMREVSNDRPRVSQYVSEIVSFRLVIASLLAISTIIVASLSYSASNAFRTIVIESTLILFTVSLAGEWAFQGIEKMHMVFVSFLTTSALQLGLIFTFVKSPKDVFKTPILYFIATIPIIAVYLRILKFRPLMKAGDLKRMGKYLSSSLVIWSISIFAQVYNNLDIFMLGIFRGVGEVGYFTIARRIIGGVSALMIFLSGALLPRLTCTFISDQAQFRSATNKFLKLAIILTVFGLVPLIFFSDSLISLTVGKGYLPAAPALKIMSLGLIFVLFNLPFSTGLIACHLEKEVLKQAAASAVLSVFSNIILIPRYGMIGASVSFVLAELLAIVWILWIYKTKLPSMRKGV